MTASLTDDTPFRDLPRSGEVLIWSARPKLLPPSRKTMAFLPAAGGLGVFGTIQILLGLIGRSDTGPGAFHVKRDAQKIDVLIVVGLVLLAFAIVGSTSADRNRTRGTVHACSKIRFFELVSGIRRSTGLVSTRCPGGRIAIERAEDVATVWREVRDARVEEVHPAMAAFHAVSPDAAKRLLQSFNPREGMAA